MHDRPQPRSAANRVRESLTLHHLLHWSTLLVLMLVVATKLLLTR